ncbi:hypothetical protein [Actinomadura sp. 21ATH]|uniref:hypothetical protein n=1 Tax=Actinomadura sp. 21ATH TaxID=1735444 RepID=UPI0035C16578
MHARRERARLLDEFIDHALRATGNRPEEAERFSEGDGLLCAMPVETPVDEAVEGLPGSLARKLARHNRASAEAARLKAILSFSCGPSESTLGRLIGPGRDCAVAMADGERIRAELAKAPPGMVLTVVDTAIFKGYVEPEFGQNLSPDDFTEMPGDPPAWLSRTHAPVRSDPAAGSVPEPARPDGAGRTRRVAALALLVLAVVVLLAAGVLWLVLGGGVPARA